jgi:serine/threonine protein kinase
LLSPQPIAAESTPYCDVLEARVDGQDRRYWAKRYALKTLTSSLEAEAERVGREVRVLQDFSGEPGFYRYIDRSLEGPFFYVIVERVVGLTLDKWLAQGSVSRLRKLTVLKQLAAVLAKLAPAGVVHRSLSPAAVRVGDDDRVTVVNFDFCQLSSLATVDARARAQLNPAYLSRDAATPGRKLYPSDDSFSFGKLCCLVLAGKLPFETPGIDPLFLRKPALWNDYASAHGIAAAELADIQKLLAQVREERPVGGALLTMIEAWAP